MQKLPRPLRVTYVAISHVWNETGEGRTYCLALRVGRQRFPRAFPIVGVEIASLIRDYRESGCRKILGIVCDYLTDHPEVVQDLTPKDVCDVVEVFRRWHAKGDVV